MRFWHALAFAPTDELVELARASERCGYHGVTVSDHLFYSEAQTSAYPYTSDGATFWNAETPWPEPWAAISAMATVTERLQFTTNIYVGPVRDLFTVAKSVSTAAVLSQGRVALGIAAGWCREEYDQTGQDFSTRGRRLDEMIGALRALWSGEMVEHHGTHYDFAPVQMSPAPATSIPIYIGGDSDAALRRAAALGDGWVGNAYDMDAADAVLDRLHAQLRGAGRGGEAFEVILGLRALPDQALIERYAERGVTGMLCAPWMRGTTPSERIEAVERFADRYLVELQRSAP
jgi:probable F420-dependent oxidoreductase